MIDNCANPQCSKQLRYLREGTIYIFESSGGSPDLEGSNQHRLEHYWLCGHCSQALFLERTAQKQIRVSPRKKSLNLRRSVSIVAVRPLAS